MPAAQAGFAPNLGIFLKSLKGTPLESSIETLVALLKRRQIKNSRACAVAVAHLLLRVVAKFKWSTIGRLLERIQQVGIRLMEAQPRELVVGNIVRRVLGMVRDEAKEDRTTEDFSDSNPNSQLGSPKREQQEGQFSKAELASAALSPLRHVSTDLSSLTGPSGDDVFRPRPQGARPPMLTSHTSYAVLNGVPVQQSMFNLLSATPTPAQSPSGSTSPHGKSSVNASSLSHRITSSSKDLKAEIISGVEEIIDELDQVDDQIASYAQEHIHSNEVILTHSSSLSVQKFLLKAAEKRKFTVIIAESYPNDHAATHASVTGQSRKGSDDDEYDMDGETFMKPLSAAGLTVILITDASIFAIMSRVNKVILATHAVIANGGLIAAVGARIIAKAAKIHRTPVIVVSGVYKLSPEYPFEFESLIEYGDPAHIASFADGPMVDKLEIDNPVYDYVPPDLVDLYITNLGAHAPSYLYRIVADHYKPEDIYFNKPEYLPF